ncbi:MAG: two-component regulator propeller domain-containing protein [Tepidisphaerales bacterium]
MSAGFLTLLPRLGVAALAVLLSCPAARALDPNRTLTQCLQRIWQVQQGLPQATICSILQTRDGYLWLGTQTGLVRFDGMRFTSINRVGGESLENVWVQALCEDADGGLWLGTNGAGAIRIHGGTIQRYGKQQGLGSETIHQFFRDARGALWICGDGGLARLDGSKLAAYGRPQGLAMDRAYAACEAKDGTLWIGGDSGDLNAWNGSAFTTRPLKTVPRFVTVRALVRSADDALWVGTSAGLVRIKDGEEHCYTTADGLADSSIFCLSVSPDGSLWIGTKDGFSRFRRGEFESFRTKDGLSQSTVYALCEDHEGSLWAGTKHGLNQFIDRRTIPFTASEGLASNDTGPVLQDGAGNIWVGTLSAGLSRFDGHRFSALTTQHGLASNFIYALADGADGELWIGTDRGLNTLRDGRVQNATILSGGPQSSAAVFRGAAVPAVQKHGPPDFVVTPRVDHTYTTAQGLPADFVRCLLRDRKGVLWAGTSHGLAALRGERFVMPAGTGQPLQGAVLAMTERRDGTLVIATERGGLFSCAGDTLRELPRESAAPADIDAFFEDKDGLLWMGTLGGGLRLLRNGRIQSYSVSDGLFDDDIYGIVVDVQDRLWMACSKGLFTVGRSDLVQFADGSLKSEASTPFSPTDSLRTIQCKSGVQPAAWKMRDGQMWFATVRGIVVVDPERFGRKLSPPPVVIEDVIVDGKSESPGRIVDLPPGRRNLEFRYTALSLISPSRITFRYKLDGFDADWVDAGGRREAFYTNLPPKHYRFLVKACNADGTWSESPAAASFLLRPHYWQQWWFWPACAAILLACGVAAYRLRIRRIKDRLRLIVVERGRIARELHDTLLQGFSGVTMEMQALRGRLSSADQRAALDDIIRDAANSMQEARRSLAGLRSEQGPGSGGSGLAVALAQATIQMTELKDVRVKLQLQECDPGLPADVQYNLVRIAQEAIANALQHAAAGNLDVRLDCDAEYLNLVVSDDGRGFDTADSRISRPGHYGLVGMRERAGQIGAEFRIESHGGRGTRVCVRLPISRSGPDAAAGRPEPTRPAEV